MIWTRAEGHQFGSERSGLEAYEWVALTEKSTELAQVQVGAPASSSRTPGRRS
ncbi:hypothetical protein ACFYT4_31545 [Streptomyces sp. NPDC004609]|uniref:hypothetical protein n=1 Tax=Streptomyces sp. NPDC004609 TaxID=3364704 RepID=UPI0036B8FBB7